jgi:hypothetical protein
MVGGPSRREDVPWIEVDGDVVAVTPTGDIHVLRGAAAALWQLLDGESLDGLDEIVADTLGVDRVDARADIETSLDMLDRIGIVDPGTG